MTRRLLALALFASAVFSGEPLRASEPLAAAATEATTRILSGGAVLRLAPGTRVEIVRSLKLQLGPPGAAQTPTQVVKLISGRLDIDVPPSPVPKTAVLVQAPRKISAVAKGGHSTVVADADRITLAAIDGDMLAASGNDWKTLASGVVRSFVGREATAEEHAVPGVPRVNVASALLMARPETLATAHAEATGVKDADRYELGVWRSSDAGPELVQRVASQAGRADFSSLEPGRYRVSARAVDRMGIFGRDSEGVSLRVVGLELPRGARSDSGVVLLGQRSRVKLLAATGLEASYGASEHFVNAPESVGLSRGESTVLRLREPGTTNEVKLALEPRTLRADVQISPKHARWPEDTLEVTVRLFDARGRAVAATVGATPRVLIDVEPARVEWSRTNNTLHAVIPKPRGRGPWVVRVEVADEFGEPAGRDFMEVANAESERVSAR